MSLNSLAQGSGINEASHRGDTISRKPDTAGVLPNTVFIRREIDAIYLIFSDVTVQPLNFRAHVLQYLQGMQGQLPNLGLRKRASSGYFPFNNKLRHAIYRLPPRLSRLCHRLIPKYPLGSAILRCIISGQRLLSITQWSG